MHHRKLLFIIFPLLILIRCASTSVVLTDDTVTYPPTERVEILTEKPNQPYKIIAKLETKGYKGTSQTTILKSMREKAKSIGADAIVPVEDASEYNLPGVIFNPWLGGYQTIGGGKIPILRGYAIKYIGSSSYNRLGRNIPITNDYNPNLKHMKIKKPINEESIYLKIQKVYKQYLLLYVTPETPMKENDELIIVRYEMQDNHDYGYSPMAIGKVIKIKDYKVVLKYDLIDNSFVINKNDKVEYKYMNNLE